MKVFTALVASALICGRSLHSHAQSTAEVKSSQYKLNADTYVRRAWHSSVLVGDWLYIDGGDIVSKTGPNNATEQRPLNTTLALDMTQSWSDSLSPLNIIETQKPPGCPSLNHGNLWWDNTNKSIVMGFSGELSLVSEQNGESPDPLSIWRFFPDGKGSGTWKQDRKSSDPLFKNLTRPSSGLSAFSNDSAYYLGGIANYLTTDETARIPESKSQPLPGLVEYDFKSNSWHNNTATKYSPEGVAAFGRMEFVPNFGSKGLFVMLGGATGGLDSYYAGNEMATFDNITVYDPSTQKWYSQKATGDIPEPRYGHCSAGAMPADKSSYEIIMFGGFGGENGPSATKYDETYSLTIPGFNWAKAQYPATSPRYGHTCAAVGGRQFMTIGGVAANVPASDKWTAADNVKQGFGIFDMTLMVWVAGYEPSSAVYEQSTPVKDFYRNNGGRFPVWTQKEFGVVMGDKNAGAAEPDNGKKRTGIIVGSVIGALILVSLILAIVLIVLRRRRSRMEANRRSDPAMLDSKSPISEAYTNFSKPAAVLGMGHNEKPERVVELAHPQVAAVELDSGDYKLRHDSRQSETTTPSPTYSGDPETIKQRGYGFL
ncbi:MAG: hypothetical protein M1825_004222 [Sarcosagium campestre]|nr:MAG: hypothetical protein M1825_004222 [Sarcosagium campestre]